MSERKKMGEHEAQVRRLREKRYAEWFGNAKPAAPAVRKKVAVKIVEAVMAKPAKKQKTKKGRQR